MVPVFTLEAEASCASLEGPIALASKEELQRVLLRICSISDVARAVATEMVMLRSSRRCKWMYDARARRLDQKDGCLREEDMY